MIMGYKIENQVTNYGTRNSINNLIIAHETANSNSTIEGEVAYMKRNASSAFVTHFVGGGGRIIQTAQVGKVSWGAGPKANGYAYAQIELCRSKDKATFQKDYAAYIWLLRELASKAGIPKTLDTGSSVYDKGIKSHKWVSDKLGGTDHQDPYGYLASWGINKEQFAKDISGGLGSASPVPSKPTAKPAPTKSIETLANETIAGKHGSGDARKKALGSEYNAVQKRVNELLNSKPSATKSIDTLVKETLAGKHGNGDARKKSLGSNYNTVMAVINGKTAAKPVTNKKRVCLPKSAKTWRVYKTSGPYTTGKEVGFLAPAQYGGLNYEIIKTLATDVYQIKTSTFGNVAIYAAKSTGATIK